VVLAEHRGTDADAAFVPDGTLIVTGSSDGEVRVWDAATGASRACFECNDRVNALAVSPDGMVVAATTTITARTWEIATGIPGVTISGGHAGQVRKRMRSADPRRPLPPLTRRLQSASPTA
jgi:WD40 repeat protein